MDTFVLIDTDEMRFRKAARSVEQLEYWAELLIPAGNDFVITGGERRYYAKHSMMSLRLLYQNATGRELDTNDYGRAVQAVADVATDLPCDDTPVEALATRLGRKLRIATQAGGVPPELLPTPPPPPTHLPPWLKGPEVDTSPSVVPPPWASNPKAEYREPNVAPPLLTEQRAAEAKPTMVVERPRPGTTSELVWQLCDQGWLFYKRDAKQAREYAIAEACKQGVNPATARTQCSRWAAANGF